MSPTKPPVLLIHGLWMTPRSWGPFRRYYTERGYRVYAPAWPRLQGDVEDVCRDPSALAGLGLREIVDRYERFVCSLGEPPIIIGHSTGGLVAQILLDRGLGVAGVALAPPPPKGVWHHAAPAGWVSSLASHNPFDYWRTVSVTFEQFLPTIANVMPEGEARAAYERYVVPGPGRVLFQLALANLNPWAASRVDFRNDRRAPLLLVAGGDDHLNPPSLVRATYRRYAGSAAVTAYRVFPHRSHLIIAQDGWREVASCVLEWAESWTTGGVSSRRPRGLLV
jgi:pimeloyl-ACP methyl ester carboxylesterase